MQARCTTCNGAGQGEGIGGWRFPCWDCVGRVADRLEVSGGIKTWQRYADADLAGFDWRVLSAHHTDLLQHYAAELEMHLSAGWGLILTGGVGCGKTHLAIGLGVVALGTGFSVYATTLGDLLLAIRSSFQRETEGNEADLMAQVCYVDLLILDDLGVEKPTPWARERLAYIINQRYAARLATIVTTNLTLDEMERSWDRRVVSRLYGTAQAIGMHDIADYRRHQRRHYVEYGRTDLADTPEIELQTV